MNSLPLSTYARIAFVTTAAVVLSACAHVRDDYRPAPHYESRVTYYDYRYYPEADCYYDTRTRVYIYFEHDHWVRARALPPRMRSHLGRHVNIRSPHDRPYEDLRRHREQYAPDRHKSERYNKIEPDHRGRDIRNDAPRRDILEREHNDSRKYTENRDRNGQDQSRGQTRDRSTSTDQRHQSAPAQEQQRPESKPRFKPEPNRHEAPVSKAPTKRDDKTRESENHKEKTQDRNRDAGQQRSNNRHDDDYAPRAWNERNSPEENSARDR